MILGDDLALTVPADRWTAVDGHPHRLHLRGGIRLNGTELHVTAVAVRSAGGLQRAVDEADTGDLDAVYDLSAASSPLRTTRIRGVQYVLSATPYEN